MAINSIGGSSYYAPSILDMWNRNSANNSAATGQTAAQQTQTQAPPAMFSGVDLDSSGGLDQSEFDTLLSKINEASDQSLNSDKIFSEYDEDGDGILSATETMTALEENQPQEAGQAQGPPPPPPEEDSDSDAEEIYAAADVNENGFIDATEAANLVDMMNAATGQELTAADLIDSYDEDDDGVLSQAETITALEANRPSMPPMMMAGINSYQQMSGLFASFDSAEGTAPTSLAAAISTTG